MRVPFLALLLAATFAGCAETPSPPPDPEVHVHCEDTPLAPQAWYLAEGYTLANATGPAGSAPANQGHEAYTAEYAAWTSQPLPAGMHLEGNVTIDLHVDVRGATFAPGPDALQFYLQFGSNRSYASGGAAVSGMPVVAGTVRVNATFTLPEGGFTIEAGDGVRLLVTSLFQGAGGAGATVRFGGDTPSHVRFEARCSEPREWLAKRNLAFPVILPGHQGAFTGAVPPQEGLNRLTVGFDLEEGTSRLTVRLEQMGGIRGKSDMDIYLLDAGGSVLYAGATPFANETMVLWPENLAAFAPPGPYQVRIESYSGANYTGRLRILMDEAPEHAD